MEDDDDDFTFPTVVGDPVAVARLVQLPLPPPDLASPASPLWPFARSALPKTAAAVEEEEEEGGEPPRVAVDEERMDLLWDWEGDAAATAEPRSGGCRARAAGPAGDDGVAADAERMDKLWESFNEDLLLLRRRRSRTSSSRSHPGPLEWDDPPVDRWFLCDDYLPPWDAESQATSSPAERGGLYGCAPTMLRASSRAGGAGQFCTTSTHSRLRRRGGWALLLRLFRRLFAVDKTPTPSQYNHGGGGGIFVP